jgi:uridine kinase
VTDPQGAPLRAPRAAGRTLRLGKSHLSQRSGLPLLDLDDFYKDGDDPSAPRHPTLGIVDWDDVRSWDADGALAGIEAICRDGAAQAPVHDIARDGRVGTRLFDVGQHAAFVGTGNFAAELVQGALERGLLADAVVVRRSRVKNFFRRLGRDLAEHRRPPLRPCRDPRGAAQRRCGPPAARPAVRRAPPAG